MANAEPPIRPEPGAHPPASGAQPVQSRGWWSRLDPLPKALLIVVGFVTGLCVLPVIMLGAIGAIAGPSASRTTEANAARSPVVATTTVSTAPAVRPQTTTALPLTIPPPTITTTTTTTKPAAAPTTKTTTKPPPPPPPPPQNLCGAPSNPWGYNFCGGSYITSPASGICAYFNCIDNFWNGKGYVIQCKDGMLSKSGGRQGSCSYHDGNRRPLYK